VLSPDEKKVPNTVSGNEGDIIRHRHSQFGRGRGSGAWCRLGESV